MLFPTHLVAAYLVGRRWNLPTYWVVLGAALPDVVDKPLAMAGVLELYHTVGHSLLLLGALSVLGLAGRQWAAFLVGWASHLFLDSVHQTVNGRPEDVRFLAWPVVRHEPAVQLGPVDFLFHYPGTPSFFLEIPIWIAAIYVLMKRSEATER